MMEVCVLFMKVDSKLRESVELWREGEKMAQRILKRKESTSRLV